MKIESADVVILRVLLVLSDALLRYSVGLPLSRFTRSSVTVPSPVTAVAPVPRVPLFAQLVIVQPVMVQFVPFPALSQSVAPATHPGLKLTPHTTEPVANAVLFAVLESQGLVISTLKVTLVPLAARVGVTGIRRVSVPVGAVIAVVFVHVTPVPTWAPHDHPLSTNVEDGHVIFVGTVNITVCTPLELAFQTFDTVIGSCESVPTASGHSGCPIPGTTSGTFPATYGTILHSRAPE